MKTLLISFMKSKPNKMQFGKIYFWTAYIHKNYPLLSELKNRMMIVDAFDYLSQNHLATIFSYAIFPHKVQVVWMLHKMNGNENPKSSFLKFTAHRLLCHIKSKRITYLFRGNYPNKRHQLWGRNTFMEVKSEEGLVARTEQLRKFQNPLPRFPGELQIAFASGEFCS